MRPPERVRGVLDSVLPRERFGDHLAILAGTGQNIAGLAVYVVAFAKIGCLPPKNSH